MRLAILAALGRQPDFVAVNFRPAQGRDLIAARRRECQQLDGQAERPAGLSGGLPHRSELVVG